MTDSQQVVQEQESDASLRYAQKKLKKASNKKIYYHSQLALAILTVASYIGALVSTALLLHDYFAVKALIGSPVIICALYGWKTLIQIVLNFLSEGPSFNWILDLLQISELAAFVKYVMEWKKHNGQTTTWKRSYYLPHQPFVSTVLSMPSLIIQAWILLEYPSDRNSAQYACIVFTSIHAFAEQMCSFFYISVSGRIYNFMALASIFSLAVRATAGAFILYSIQEYAFIWWFGSYLLGLILLVALWKRQKSQKKDDPLQLTLLKVLWTHQVAVQLSFSSIPFAAQHSVMEFWHGYIVGEFKLLIEYGIAIGIIAITFSYERGFEFYTLYGVGLALVFVYAGFIYFTNMAVSRALRRRSLFSTTKIITLFVYFGNWLQEKNLGKQADGGLDSMASSETGPSPKSRESRQDAEYEAHVRQFNAQHNAMQSFNVESTAD